jgi:alkanesulfonate monooxygenase SsuD/methylene tetrahydromethanopterin reductase-like flavin-dependent oxidoreductase (luciferase family)
MPAVPRQLHLNAFLRNIGQHEAAWRLPETRLSGITDIGDYIELAQIAERGKLDAVFFADHPVLKQRTQDRPFDALDPFTLIAALATATSRIGFVATASTTYNDPYGLARRFATLDHVSRGRAAWNAVTTANAAAAANFGLDAHPDPAARYARADEFIEVALKLWDSWEDDAVVGDKERGVFVDPDKIHAINHAGAHFRVAGPLEVPRSPQGRPVIFQAGSSEPGKDLAAKYADAIFTAQPNLADAQDFYRDIKSRVRAFGRNPDEVLILPGLSAFIGGTEAEAAGLAGAFRGSDYSDLRSCTAQPGGRLQGRRGRSRQAAPPAFGGRRCAASEKPRHTRAAAAGARAPDRAAAPAAAECGPWPPHLCRNAGAGRRYDRALVPQRRCGRIQSDSAGFAGVAVGLRRNRRSGTATPGDFPHRLRRFDSARPPGASATGEFGARHHA